MDRWLAPQALQAEMKDWVTVQGQTKHTLNYFGVAGDWSGWMRPLKELPVFREAAQLVACGMDYRGTEVYAELVALARSGRPARRQHGWLDSRMAIDAYFQRYVALFEALQRHGYRPACRQSQGPVRMGAVLTVAMGPHGELVKLPGAKHRLAAALHLGLPQVSVRLGMLHADLVVQRMHRDAADVATALRNCVEDFRMGRVVIRSSASGRIVTS